MPTFDRPSLITCRCALTAVLAGAAVLAPAYAQRSAIDPIVKTPPQLTSLVDSLVTVTVSRLDPSQTVTQSFAPNPAPSAIRSQLGRSAITIFTKNLATSTACWVGGMRE